MHNDLTNISFLSLNSILFFWLITLSVTLYYIELFTYTLVKLLIKQLRLNFNNKNIFLLLILCFCGSFSISQIRNDQLLWNNELGIKYDLKNEIITRRTLNEKHFKRADGKVDMLVSSDPLNYLENNQWETIFTSIEDETTSVYKYSNTKNIFKSYYSENILNGFKTVFENEDIFEMRNLSVFYERNGEKIGVKSIQSSVGEANENKVKYSNVYGNQIDLIITQKGGKRKVDYILKSKDFIETEYFDAEYLVFSEDIFLPKGWSAKLENGSVVLINSIGQVSFSLKIRLSLIVEQTKKIFKIINLTLRFLM